MTQIIEWVDSYVAAKESGQRFAGQYAPTVERCSTHFDYKHSEMLALLKQIESWGLVKRCHIISAGIAGNGYDGSLHSEVMPTERGRKFLLQAAKGLGWLNCA